MLAPARAGVARHRPGAQHPHELQRRGEVIGRPRITYFRPGGGAQARAAFVGSIKAALRLCTPLPLSERLGAALAGRPFVFRFVDARPI